MWVEVSVAAWTIFFDSTLWISLPFGRIRTHELDVRLWTSARR